MSKVNIGNVLVHKGMPDGGNPYRGQSLLGNERKVALSSFMRGESTKGFTFWHAPSCGGAYRLHRSEEVEWGTWTGVPS